MQYYYLSRIEMSVHHYERNKIAGRIWRETNTFASVTSSEQAQHEASIFSSQRP